MHAAPQPIDEAQRLASLLCLRILDTAHEERFERIVRLVATHFGVPIAAINLIDAERQWSKAQLGLACDELPRAISFCAYTVARNRPLVVPDTLDDPRFCDNPLVAAGPHLRFYAGVPLRSMDGHSLGTLCISDYAPRQLGVAELAQLQDFAAWAERELTTQQIGEALLHQQAIEDALRLSEARYEAVIASLSEGIVIQDADGVIRSCNASAERILGLSAAQLIGRPCASLHWRLIHEDGSPFALTQHPALLALRTGQAQEGVRLGVYSPAGELRWVTINSHPLRHPDHPNAYGVASSFVDITQHKQYEQQLRSYQQQLERHNAALTVLAATDGLTGIRNKRVLLEQLASAVRAAQQLHRPLSLILLDVDQFKAYNDSFGHLAGDEVLKQVAALLRQSARSSDLIARYGGEEFALLLPATDLAGAKQLAERCRVAIAQATFPHRLVTASFGIATLGGVVQTPDDLIAHADAALYAAKRQGRNTVRA